MKKAKRRELERRAAAATNGGGELPMRIRAAMLKLSHSAGTGDKIRLNGDDSRGLMAYMNRLSEYAQASTEPAPDPRVTELLEKVEVWKKNPRERMTLPQTLTYIAELFAE